MDNPVEAEPPTLRSTRVAGTAASRRGAVTHVVASIDEEAAGPSYSVPRLCTALQEERWNVKLVSISDRPQSRVLSFPHQTFPPDLQSVPALRRLRFSSALLANLRQTSGPAQILHAHGLWLMPNIYPGQVSSRQGSPLVVSPRGMLGPAALRFSRHQKQAMWLLAQRTALLRARCLHATSWQEFDDIRRLGIRQPVAVIPNGIDLPPLQQHHAKTRFKALFVGRLHPKKGLDVLLKAWANIEAEFPQWDLEICGPSEIGYRGEMEALAGSLQIRRVVFRDPLYGQEKNAAYASSDLFVMPTQHENFGMTVAEALAAGVPVLCSKGAPWSGLETHRCGWWIDRDVAAFSEGLQSALRMDPARRREMGDRGRAWMLADFGWTGIARTMSDVYTWLIEGQSPPSCVVSEFSAPHV